MVRPAPAPSTRNPHRPRSRGLVSWSRIRRQARAILDSLGVDLDLDAPVRSLRVRLLSVRDDGVGGADPGRGSGLAGLADRVEALCGSIHVDSAAGAGTHITVRLPREYELD